MAISIQIEPETGVAAATCSGLLSRQDAQEAVAALWENPVWQGRASVWDFRAAQFDISPSDARLIAEYILRNQPSPAPEKVAFVTPNDADFGMARMFEVFREDSKTAFRVFRDLEQAMAWAQSCGTDAA